MRKASESAEPERREPLGFLDAVAAFRGVEPFPALEVARAMGVEVRLVRSDGPEMRGADVYGVLRPGSREDGIAPVMLIDAGRSPTRRLHAAATLIAHLTYHRDLLGSGVALGPDPDVGAAGGTNAVERRHRTQAHAVAARLLMPSDAMADVPEGRIEGRAAELGVTPAMLRIRLGRPRPEVRGG